MLERDGVIHQSPEYKMPVENNTEPFFDAVLVHGYWFSEVKSGITGKTHIKPSSRTHYALRAAAKFYVEGKGAGKIVLAGGHIWGDEYPSLAELMTRDLVKKYHIPREAIEIKEGGNDTGSEIDALLADGKKDEDLADVAMRTHNWTLPLHYKRRGREDVQRFAVEDILQYDDPRVKRLVNKFSGNRVFISRYEWSYRFYQVVNRMIMFFDPEYKLLKKRAGKERSKKSEYSLGGPFKIFPVDKYQL